MNDWESFKDKWVGDKESCHVMSYVMAVWDGLMARLCFMAKWEGIMARWQCFIREGIVLDDNALWQSKKGGQDDNLLKQGQKQVRECELASPPLPAHKASDNKCENRVSSARASGQRNVAVQITIQRFHSFTSTRLLIMATKSLRKVLDGCRRFKNHLEANEQ